MHIVQKAIKGGVISQKAVWVDRSFCLLNYCLAAKAPQPIGQRSACGANKAVVAISRSLNENSFALGVINYCFSLCPFFARAKKERKKARREGDCDAPSWNSSTPSQGRSLTAVCEQIPIKIMRTKLL